MKYCSVKLLFLILAGLIIFFAGNVPIYSEVINVNTYAGRITKGEDHRINWEWWEKFNDPLLLDILHQSINNNFDLQIADLKTKEAENYSNSTKRDYLPSVQLGAGYRYAKYSNLTPYGQTIDYNKENSKKHLIILPLQVSYELDFWGKNRTNLDYFLENKDYYEFEKNFITLSTLTEVASLYFNILNNEKLISLYEELYGLKKEKLSIAREKFMLELVPKPDVLLAEKELKLSEENLILLKALNGDLKNQLSLLVFGDKEKTPINFKDIDDISLFYDTDLEISTEKIAYRPDILMAEKQIKMAKLDADAVRKSFLPSFAITGDLFQITDLFDDFFNTKSIRYRAGAGILYNLFNKGKNIAELRGKKNIYEQMLKNYEKTIVSSINDVNNSLYYLKSSMKNLERTKEISGLDRESLDIQQQKLDMDLITYNDYIETREKLINSRIQEYKSRTEYLIHTLSLYKALGGNV